MNQYRASQHRNTLCVESLWSSPRQGRVIGFQLPVLAFRDFPGFIIYLLSLCQYNQHWIECSYVSFVIYVLLSGMLKQRQSRPFFLVWWVKKSSKCERRKKQMIRFNMFCHFRNVSVFRCDECILFLQIKWSFLVYLLLLTIITAVSRRTVYCSGSVPWMLLRKQHCMWSRVIQFVNRCGLRTFDTAGKLTVSETFCI